MDDMAVLMAPWGWQRHVGRMYGYLLLRETPATLDEIAADLGISKSNASVAARTLEKCGNARRLGETGTKRIYYAAPDNHAGPFIAKAELLERLVRLVDGRQAPGMAPQVSARLGEMSDFLGRMRAAILGVTEARED